MRRWVFAAFVLANIGMLLWGVQYVEPERPAAQLQVPEDINAGEMKLLSEVPPAELVARSKPPPPPPPPPPPEPLAQGQVCYRLGPVADSAQVKNLEQALGTQALAFTKREERVSGAVDYRVLLPSFPSREAAERKRRELTRLGFRDHALLREEGLENAISLGVFSVLANAQDHLKQLAGKGVKAELQTREHERSVYWFELFPLAPAAEIVAYLNSQAKEITGSEVSEIPCPAPVTSPPPALESAESPG